MHESQQGELRKCGANRRECFGWLCQRCREMGRDIWLVLRVRSFQIIVLQVGCLLDALPILLLHVVLTC